MKKIFAVIFLLGTCAFGSDLQLGNWRNPYFNLASEMEYDKTPSKSRMFWDGIGDVDLYQSSLWPDSSRLSKDHWFLEPAVYSGFRTDYPDSQDAGYWKINLLNSITYKNFYIRQTLDVDKRYDYDNYYPAHTGRAVRGRIEEAFLQYNWKYGFVRLGRMQRNWGPFADRSLLLSSNPYTYDALEWQLQSSFFEFRHLFAAFPSEKSSWDADGKQINRYLTAHALNVLFGKWMTIGVFESVLFTRDKGFPDLSYVNPVSIYSVINTNQEGVGNLMLGFQWNIHPFTENISYRGQVLLDDFQVDHKTVDDEEPTHWGMDMGLYWRNAIPIQLKNLVKLEYNFRSKWLYTVPDLNTSQGERYTYLTKSLGMSENDGYKASAGVDIIGKKFWVASLLGGYESKGANTTSSRWNDLTHIPGLPFDSIKEPVEKTISFGFNVSGYFKNYVDLRCGFVNNWVENENNVHTSDYKYKPEVNAELTIHFSDLIVKFPD